MTTSPTKFTADNLQIKAIELNNIGKKYHFTKNLKADLKDFWALKDISLDICKGHVFGVIGRNGAGKTTLLNIIAGVLTPTEGKMLLNGKVLGLFNLGVGFQDELSGKENIFLNGAILGVDRKEIEAKLESIIEFSELGNFISMPLGTYSQGMRLRLGFSIVVNLDFDILAVDEVLAVGDALFQSKCYERLVDFRRMGKTLIITSQDMAIVERLCDEVVILDHGRILFKAKPKDAIGRYRDLLNTERFFVGSENRQAGLVENTKKWADNISNWEEKLGTKEVSIDSVEMINKFGIRCSRINSEDPLRVRVSFTAKNDIKEPHFGIAIFRKDGVYCYGPNTIFDGYSIRDIKIGKGAFELRYKKILLAPGEYRVSVGIWDKNETLAFDYHNGYYKLIIAGVNNTDELLKMPFKFKGYFRKINKCKFNRSLLVDKWESKMDDSLIVLESVRLIGRSGREGSIFLTNEPVKLSISFKKIKLDRKKIYLCIDIYRDDEVYCQGISALLKNKKEISIFFPEFKLLPGGYKISIGLWDDLNKHFLIFNHGICGFKMVWKNQDHGTVYLDHEWDLRGIAYEVYK